MPIPQLDKKNKRGEHPKDASEIRKQRAASRSGKNPKASGKKSASAKKNGKTGAKKSSSKGKSEKPKTLKEKIIFPFRRENIVRTLLIAGASALIVVLIAVISAYAWVSKDLADISDLDKRATVSASQIYASDGTTLLYEVGDNRRIDVTFDEINPYIHQALISLEDRRYYEHNGFDPVGLSRAVFRLVFSGFDLTNAEGASTLTQQFTGNAISGRASSATTKIGRIKNKVKEMILAIRVEQRYSKEEVLEFYLNDIYFGPNYQGVESAAQSYFEKSAAEVTLSEAAILASMPKNPSILTRDPERLKSRRDYALTVMVEEEYITQEEADAAIAEEIPALNATVTEIHAPHFVFHVLEELEETYGENTLHRGGLRVTTTLDWDKQEKAEQAVADNIGKVDQYGGSNAALVSIDAHSGQIKAMVGSRDFFDRERDGQVNVATSLRQPGSSFKPLVYLTAFDKGYTPDTQLMDVETDFLTEAEGKYHPRNYDLGERGPVNLRSSLATSLNITAVKLLYLVGVENTLDIAEKFGYTSLGDRSRFGLSLVLGGAEVTLLEHTSTFATFAREGEKHRVSSILKVEDRDGRVLEEWADQTDQVLPPESVRMLNAVLSDSGARAGFNALNLNGRQSAAKTGTTNDYRDAWTMGYTPSLATGVWVGNNDNSEMARGAAGLIVAAPIWNQYMNAVLDGTPAEGFNAASYTAATEVLGGALEQTVTKKVDSVTGELIPDECLEGYPAEYVGEKEYKEVHNILHYLRKDDIKAGAPEDPRAADPMYEAWETGVQLWAQNEERSGEYLSDETPKVDCTLRNTEYNPTVSMRSLVDGESYSKDELVIQARVKPGTGRTITTVEYIIDGSVVVDSATEQSIDRPYTVTSTYEPQNLTKGDHTVTVKVTDNLGATASETVNITYTKNEPSGNSFEENTADESQELETEALTF